MKKKIIAALTERTELKPRSGSQKDGSKIPLVCDEEEEETEEVEEEEEDDDVEDVFKEKTPLPLTDAAAIYAQNHVDNHHHNHHHQQQHQQSQSPSSPNDTLEQIFSDRLFPRLISNDDPVVVKRDRPNNTIDLNNIPNIRISAASSTHSVNSDKTPTKEQMDNYCVAMEQASC